MSEIIEGEVAQEAVPAAKKSLLNKAKEATLANSGLIVAGVAAVAVVGIGYATYRYTKHLSALEEDKRERTDAIRLAAAKGELNMYYDVDRATIYAYPEIAVEMALKNGFIDQVEASKAYDYLDTVQMNSMNSAMAINGLLNTMINTDPLCIVQTDNGFNIRTGDLEAAVQEVHESQPSTDTAGRLVIDYLS